MAFIADRCPNIQVTVVDINQARIDTSNQANLSHLPMYEPGLDAVAGRNLRFSTAVEAEQGSQVRSFWVLYNHVLMASRQS